MTDPLLHYTLSQTTDDAYARWRHSGPVTLDMHQLMVCVATALAHGAFNNRDLDARVVPQFDFTPEERERGRGKVEGGVVGYEIYFARKRVEAEADATSERDARARMGLQVGQGLGTLTLRAHQTIRRIVVVGFEPQGVLLTYTRGNQRYQATIPAVVLEALSRQSKAQTEARRRCMDEPTEVVTQGQWDRYAGRVERETLRRRSCSLTRTSISHNVGRASSWKSTRTTWTCGRAGAKPCGPSRGEVSGRPH